MIQVSAGSAAQLILILPTAGLVVTASIRRLDDDLFWNPSTETWESLPESMPTTEIEPGVYKFILPDNVLMGAYLVKYDDTIEFHYQDVFAGGFKYNSDLNTCIIYGTIKDIKGAPLPCSQVVVEPIPTTSFIDMTALAMSSRMTYTDDNGGFAIEVVRNAQVIIIINDIGFRKRIDIPDLPSVALESL